MEAFTLLNYWKSGRRSGGTTSNLGVSSAATQTTTIVTALANEEEEENDSSSDGGNNKEDGPFFDLEFALLDNEDGECERGTVHENEIEFDEEEVEEREIEQDLSCSSPADELFFKGRLAAAEDDGGEMKSGQSHIPASLVKSAAKLRVFMLNLKRSKPASKQDDPETLTTHTKNSKFLTVKWRLEDAKGLLLRASSNSKLNNNNNNNNSCNESAAKEQQEHQQKSLENCEKERKNKKEMVQRYLNMVKPLYVNVSKRNTTTSDVKKEVTAVKSEEKVKIKQGLNMKVMGRKHLGKTKSSVVHSIANNVVCSKKRDDSLLELQDGIQSAILHCKRSFNSSSSSSDDGEETASILTRSASDQSHEKKSTMTSAGVAELIMLVKEG